MNELERSLEWLRVQVEHGPTLYEAYHKLRQERDSLALIVERMREALSQCQDEMASKGMNVAACDVGLSMDLAAATERVGAMGEIVRLVKNSNIVLTVEIEDALVKLAALEGKP